MGDLVWEDYLVFASSVVISILIGVWYARPGARQDTTEGYLKGNKELKVLPVMISLIVTYVSAIQMIGLSAEVYFFGIKYVLLVFAIVGGVILTALVWVPLLYPLDLTSSNQYLRIRYGTNIAAFMGTIFQLLETIMTMGIVLYAPATMFDSVGGLPIWATLLIIGICSSGYTAIGGIKGVVFTDVFQAFVMLSGLLMVTIQGFNKAGGLSEGFEIFEDYGRTDFDDYFVPDPHERIDFWSTMPLQFLILSIQYGLKQAAFQRYSSMSTLNSARLCMLGVVPGAIIFTGLSCLCGVSMFAYYAYIGCDPFVSGKVDDVNHLLIQLVLDILDYPGIPGLFIAAVFCSTLSTLSSQLTALAAFTWDDLIRLKYDHLEEKQKTLILKILVVFYGCLSTGAAFICNVIKGSLIELLITLTQAAAVPLGLIFMSGALFPKLNFKGSLLSALLATGFVIWVIVGKELSDLEDLPLPLPYKNCGFGIPGLPVPNQGNVTLLSNVTVSSDYNSTMTAIFYTSDAYSNGTTTEQMIAMIMEKEDPNEDVFTLYKISRFWLAPLGILMGIFLSFIFLFIPCFQEDRLIPENLVFPISRCFFETAKVNDDDAKNNRFMNKNENVVLTHMSTNGKVLATDPNVKL